MDAPHPPHIHHKPANFFGRAMRRFALLGGSLALIALFAATAPRPLSGGVPAAYAHDDPHVIDFTIACSGEGVSGDLIASNDSDVAIRIATIAMPVGTRNSDW